MLIFFFFGAGIGEDIYSYYFLIFHFNHLKYTI